MQPRLRIGAASDPLEHEADRAADRVVAALGAGGGEAAPRLSPAAGLPVQRQLSLGEIDDPLEREAEAMAREAVALPPSVVEDDELVHAKRVGPGAGQPPASFTEGLGASAHAGTPLPDTMRADLEGCFAHDFSDVRVHTGPDAGRLADSIGALAFTRGSHVYFGPSAG